MGTICLKTNQHRLIANLRHAFNQASMLGELLQNARRAGASRIDIEADEDSITVTDDGGGIADLQTLIFIAESGWDEALQRRENAFGLGVLSTLYFAEHLSVHSGKQAFEADTEAILRGDDIEVRAAKSRAGTRIHLAGVHSPVGYTRLPEWVAQQLQRLCEAFPVRVRYNGVELARPLADPALPWRETAMGRVLVDLHASQDWRAFLQGLPIGSETGSQVILLRDDLPARLPDRQHLLNEETDNPRIQAAVNEAFRQALMDARKTRPGPEFVASYADICLFSSNADLLNEIPWAPRAWFRDWIDHPPGHRCFERSGLEGVVDEAALDEAGVWRIGEDDDEEFTAQSWLCARGGFLLETRYLRYLDHGHWLYPMAEILSPEQVRVRHGALIDAADHEPLADDGVRLALVEDLSLRRDGDSAVRVDAVRQDGTIYLTRQASPAAVTPLVSDYVFDGRYDEAGEDEDRRTIEAFLSIAGAPDPGALLRALLPESLARVPQPRLAGATLRLAFDDRGRLRTIEDA